MSSANPGSRVCRSARHFGSQLQQYSSPAQAQHHAPALSQTAAFVLPCVLQPQLLWQPAPPCVSRPADDSSAQSKSQVSPTSGQPIQVAKGLPCWHMQLSAATFCCLLHQPQDIALHCLKADCTITSTSGWLVVQQACCGSGVSMAWLTCTDWRWWVTSMAKQ